MRRWNDSQYQHLLGKHSYEAVQPTRLSRDVEEGTLLVDRSVLEFALSNQKQKQLATYCKFRLQSYRNAGFVTQDMLTSTTVRLHVRWLLKNGWLRRVKVGLYQIVSMKKIAKSLGKYRSAVAMSLNDWAKDPVAVCYGAWIACYARTWVNRYHGAAIADELKRTHFVIASAGMIAKTLGVSERVVHSWKERAWELYWQKESVKRVFPVSEVAMLSRAGYEIIPTRKRGDYRVMLGPNVYYKFYFHATKRVRW